jgi:hypothetical protein
MDWLKSEIYGDCEDAVVSIDWAKANFEVKTLTDNAWLVLNKKDELWLKFAALEFYHSDGDGKNIYAGIVFYGEGPSGNLRECRHTYWGKDGYIFYPHIKTIVAGLEALKEFYDLE